MENTPTATEKSVEKCPICELDAPFKCTACKCVSYCGVDHQKKHWKIHKQDCHSYEIAYSDDIGRHVIASRDIKAKSVIFLESPICVGPKWCLEEFEQEIPIFPCVGCFKPVHIGAGQCPRCNWPACSVNCEGLENPQFHGIECNVLQVGCAGGEPKNPENLKQLLDYYRSDALFPLRCLLLQLKYQKKWSQLMELQSHEVERKKSKYFEDADSRIVSYLKKNFLDKIKEIEQKTGNTIIAQCDRDIIHKICGIMETNALNITLPNGQEICSLYPTACMLEHSCTPNCFYTFDLSKNFHITMIAGRDIKKGEHLSIMYTHMLWGTQMRHSHLMTNKYFICKCERCRDPTELGSFISALKCIGPEDDQVVCPDNGILLPANPQLDNTEWLCNKCPVRIANDQVMYLLSNIEAEVEDMMARKDCTIKELEDLIAKLEQFLHPNHTHIFTLKHSLIQLYGNEKGYAHDQLSEDLLERKIKMAKNLLEIVDILDPHAIRLSLYTGIILYELHLATVEWEKRKIQKFQKTDEGVGKYDYEALYVAEKYLARAKIVLENNVDIPQGKKFIEAVVNASKTLEELFELIQI